MTDVGGDELLPDADGADQERAAPSDSERREQEIQRTITAIHRGLKFGPRGGKAIRSREEQ